MSTFDYPTQAETLFTLCGQYCKDWNKWTIEEFEKILIDKNLFQYINIELKDSVPLLIAIKNINIELTKLLIKYGANVNKLLEKDGCSALFVACTNNFFQCIILANVNINTKDGMTPLMYSCYRGNVRLLLLFIQYGAEIDAKDNDGLTAVSCACQYGQAACLFVLIECQKEHWKIHKNICKKILNGEKIYL